MYPCIDEDMKCESYGYKNMLIEGRVLSVMIDIFDLLLTFVLLSN